MISGFFVCTGICARRPPSASSRAVIRPPRVATSALAAGADHGLGHVDGALLGAAGLQFGDDLQQREIGG